jgi:AcrR family transcriptional regulator
VTLKDDRTATKEQRRESLLLAARHLMSERGYRGFTVEDLAREAGMSVGSVYLHFASVDDIYAELLSEDLASKFGDPVAVLSVVLDYVEPGIRAAVNGAS